MPTLMAPLSVTSAIAAGAANSPATATAIRLFFMRSPFLIGFKPVRRVNSPSLAATLLVCRGFNLSRERKKLPRFCQNATPGGKQFLLRTSVFSPLVLRIYNIALQQKVFLSLKVSYSEETADYGE